MRKIKIHQNRHRDYSVSSPSQSFDFVTLAKQIVRANTWNRVRIFSANIARNAHGFL